MATNMLPVHAVDGTDCPVYRQSGGPPSDCARGHHPPPPGSPLAGVWGGVEVAADVDTEGVTPPRRTRPTPKSPRLGQ
jgi:hypothetical protein